MIQNDLVYVNEEARKILDAAKIPYQIVTHWHRSENVLWDGLSIPPEYRDDIRKLFNDRNATLTRDADPNAALYHIDGVDGTVLKVYIWEDVYDPSYDRSGTFMAISVSLDSARKTLYEDNKGLEKEMTISKAYPNSVHNIRKFTYACYDD